MNRPYTRQDLEDFYYKIFVKYNINSLSELEDAIKNGIISEDELLIKLDDLISPDEQRELEIAIAKHKQAESVTPDKNPSRDNIAITGLRPTPDD